MLPGGGQALARLSREAQARSVDVDIVESESGGKAGTYRSVLLSLDGDGAASLAASWEGSIQWTCPSPYRPSHPRKNWFIGVLRCEAPAPSLAADIRFETTRSSGPGGQHVNKTESAVRATHVATGISVKVQTERSQHANKRLAVLLIAHRLASHEQARDAAQRARRRQFHHEVERGSPKRVFRAPPSSRPTARSPRPGVLHRRETAGTRVTGRFSKRSAPLRQAHAVQGSISHARQALGGGKGMNSVSSPGTVWPKRSRCQSSLACSMRSLLLDTKFHQRKRGPSSGSPPSTA